MNEFKSKKGFTLVELLVVISIIALLLSILMPSLSNIRRMAQGIKCASGMKQIGMAIYLYLQDNRDTFFPCSDATFWGTWYDSDKKTSYFTRKYLHMGEIGKGGRADPKTAGNILDCPSNTRGAFRRLGYFLDYACNLELYPIVWAHPPEFPLIKLSKVRHPTSTISFTEVLGDNYFISTGGNYWKITIPQPHNKKGNFLFVDGHVTSSFTKEITDENFHP